MTALAGHRLAPSTLTLDDVESLGVLGGRVTAGEACRHLAELDRGAEKEGGHRGGESNELHLGFGLLPTVFGSSYSWCCVCFKML